ncbi:response regulator [Dokdonella sp.]|uniref:response regulator n=1 Tax=Dokdonella sp. TaxID=2291710 RepID=UPI0031C0DFBE|nr:response regulator transcription factor [Dokdonella sp.]
MTRILLADDHPLFRLALAQAVHAAAPGAQLLEAGSLAQTREVLAMQPDTDLVLLDLHMPGSHGLLGLAVLRGEFPATAIAMVSAHDDAATVRRALAHGACAFVSKRCTLDELTHALRSVLAGGDYAPASLRAALDQDRSDPVDSRLAARLARLSPQQMRVLGLVADGLLNKQIADRLDVQERTVKAHLTAIFERLGVRNRTQAGVLLRSLEVLDPAAADASSAGPP